MAKNRKSFVFEYKKNVVIFVLMMGWWLKQIIFDDWNKFFVWLKQKLHEAILYLYVYIYDIMIDPNWIIVVFAYLRKFQEGIPWLRKFVKNSITCAKNWHKKLPKMLEIPWLLGVLPEIWYLCFWYVHNIIKCFVNVIYQLTLLVKIWMSIK